MGISDETAGAVSLHMCAIPHWLRGVAKRSQLVTTLGIHPLVASWCGIWWKDCDRAYVCTSMQCTSGGAAGAVSLQMCADVCNQHLRNPYLVGLATMRG